MRTTSLMARTSALMVSFLSLSKGEPRGSSKLPYSDGSAPSCFDKLSMRVERTREPQSTRALTSHVLTERLSVRTTSLTARTNTLMVSLSNH